MSMHAAGGEGSPLPSLPAASSPGAVPQSATPKVAVILRLLWILAVVDARRGASWSVMLAAACGVLLVRLVPAELVLPIAWAHGVVIGVAAVGNVPRQLRCPASSFPPVGFSAIWMLERALWPVAGLWLGWSWLIWKPPFESPMGVMLPLAMGGVVAASAGLAGCRRLGCATADAASGVLSVTALATLAFMGLPQTLRGEQVNVVLLPVIWTTVLVLLLAAATQVDRHARLAREVTASSGPLGHSELRRWFYRLMMVGVLVGMVRWLLTTDPQVGLYGLVGGSLVASLVLPEVLLAPVTGPSAAWRQLAWVEGVQRSPWRRLQPWLVAAVVTGWPLLIAVALVPVVRGWMAVLAAASIACVVLTAMLAFLAVRRRLITADTAFAMTTVALWLAVVNGLTAFMPSVTLR